MMEPSVVLPACPVPSTVDQLPNVVVRSLNINEFFD